MSKEFASPRDVVIGHSRNHKGELIEMIDAGVRDWPRLRKKLEMYIQFQQAADDLGQIETAPDCASAAAIILAEREWERMRPESNIAPHRTREQWVAARAVEIAAKGKS